MEATLTKSVEAQSPRPVPMRPPPTRYPGAATNADPRRPCRRIENRRRAIGGAAALLPTPSRCRRSLRVDERERRRGRRAPGDNEAHERVVSVGRPFAGCDGSLGVASTDAPRPRRAERTVVSLLSTRATTRVGRASSTADAARTSSGVVRRVALPGSLRRGGEAPAAPRRERRALRAGRSGPSASARGGRARRSPATPGALPATRAPDGQVGRRSGRARRVVRQLGGGFFGGWPRRGAGSEASCKTLVRQGGGRRSRRAPADAPDADVGAATAGARPPAASTAAARRWRPQGQPCGRVGGAPRTRRARPAGARDERSHAARAGASPPRGARGRRSAGATRQNVAAPRARSASCPRRPSLYLAVTSLSSFLDSPVTQAFLLASRAGREPGALAGVITEVPAVVLASRVARVDGLARCFERETCAC